MAQRGPSGAEEFGRLLNLYFERLIELVSAHGGDVIKFAGDALLACWPSAAGREGLPEAARRAAQCGLAIQEQLHGYHVTEGLVLSLRVGLAAGEVFSASVGGVNDRWECLMSGEPLAQIGRVTGQARPGGVVVAAEAWPLLSKHFVGERSAQDEVRLGQARDPLPLRPLDPVTPEPGSEAFLRAHVSSAILSRIEAGQSGWLAELRLVTVLFLHVAGLDYVGPQALERLQSIMRVLQDTLYRYGGSIGRFSMDDKGAVLLAAFGLPPRTHEDDPARAVRAALQIRTRLAELGHDSSIGVATGRVFCGLIGSEARREYTMVGDVVNLAAGLMMAAQGDILCSAPTYQAAQARLAFQALPRFSLKGKAEPVAVYRPRGGVDQPRPRPPMVGRAAERELMDQCLSALTAGESGVLLIEGEAGVGKSRLVAELLDNASLRGLLCLQGGGDAIESSTPYHAWRSVFYQLLGFDEVLDPSRRRARVTSHLESHGALMRLAPLLNSVLPLDLPENEITAELTGEVRADNTHDLMLHLLQTEAGRAPLVVALEDAHWLDSASWGFLSLVQRRVQPLLLAVAARPLGVSEAEVYASLRDSPGAQRLLPGPLSPVETEQLLVERLGVNEISPSLTSLIYSRSEGIPFFAEELALSLRDSGLIWVAEGMCQPTPDAGDLELLTLPDSMQGVITSRIDRLAASQQLTLKIASVIGRVFSGRLLADIYPLAGRNMQLEEDLKALQQFDITATEMEGSERLYAFRQTVTQQVAYAQLPFAQRRKLHQAVAEWYERHHADDLSSFYPLLAHHWGEAGIEGKTLEYLERAGAQALRSFANREAIALLKRAVETDSAASTRSDPLRRAHWELQMGEAYVNVSKYAEGRQHLEAGLKLLGLPLPSTLPGQLASLLGQVSRQLAVRALRRDWPHASAKRRSTLLAASRAHERLAEVYYFAGDTVLSLIAALRTLNLAERAGPSPELARGYAAVGALMGFIPLHGIAEGYLDRALNTVAEVGHLPARAFVSLAVGFYYAGVGDWSRAQRHFEQIVELADRLGDRRRRYDALSNLIYVSHFQGDYSSTASIADELYASAVHRDELRIQAVALQGKANFELLEGRIDQALACLEESKALVAADSEIVDEALNMEMYGLQCLIHLRQTAYQQALRVTEQLERLIADAFPSNYGTLSAYANAAEVYLTLWEAAGTDPALGEKARSACKALRSYARVFPIGEPRARLWQGLYNWLAGKSEPAMEAWTDSLAAAKRLHMPYEEGLACFEIGRHLDARDPARWEHLVQARDIFAALGARHNLGRTEALLAEQGEE